MEDGQKGMAGRRWQARPQRGVLNAERAQLLMEWAPLSTVDPVPNIA